MKSSLFQNILAVLLIFMASSKGEITTVVICKCTILEGEMSYVVERVIRSKNEKDSDLAVNYIFTWENGRRYLVVISESRDGWSSEIRVLKVIENRCFFREKWYDLQDDKGIDELLNILDNKMNP